MNRRALCCYDRCDEQQDHRIDGVPRVRSDVCTLFDGCLRSAFFWQRLLRALAMTNDKTQRPG